ncbi:MAG: hypothetical protein AB7U05_13480 [Mangrovibacterium sp.]
MKRLENDRELDNMRNDPDNYIWGIFYFNPKDYRVILPKRNRFLGWTLNFAKAESYLILLVLVAAGYLLGRMFG